jgi:hypothetical protein
VRSVLRLGLEDAIAVVEDAIARVRPASSHTVETSDAHIRELDAFTIEAVEQDFNRLAARATRVEDERAATLVILRELMHHLQIKAVRLV